MDFLSLNLRDNVHGDFIKFELQCFNLLSNHLDCLNLSLFLGCLWHFLEDKVHFLCFLVQDLPAHMDFVLAFRFNDRLARTYVLDVCEGQIRMLFSLHEKTLY